MKKPIKPKKPSKNVREPSKSIIKSSTLCKKNGALTLLENLRWDNINWEDLEDRDIDLIDPEHIQYSMLKQVFDIIGKDFIIEIDRNPDGYPVCLIAAYEVNNDNYEKELLDFDSRFDNYAKNLLTYEEELEKYEIFLKQEKIRKAEIALEKLKGK